MKKLLPIITIAILVCAMIVALSSCSCSIIDQGSDTGTDTGTESGNEDNPIAGDDSTSYSSIRYLRITEIKDNSVVLKFNTVGSSLTYDIRCSNNEITESNFEDSEKANVSVKENDGCVEATVNGISVGKDSKKYIAVKAINGGEKSNMLSVRAGGIDVMKIEYDSYNGKNQVIHGDIIKNLNPLFDEQETSGDPLNNRGMMPSSRLTKQFLTAAEKNYDGAVSDELVGTNISPIIDLQNICYVDCVYLYYGNDSYDATIRTSVNAANYNKADEWETSKQTSGNKNSWNKVTIEKEAKYIEIVFKDGEAPTEILVYGYAVKEGDAVANAIHKLPTVGEMMGICGLVNCKTDELKCATVVREYHNVGWAYSNGNFPKKTFKTDTPHGPVDSFYLTWQSAGLNVIPCLQDNTNSIANVYDEETGKLGAPANYEQKMDPKSYLAYADLIFNYAARYGSNKSPALLELSGNHSMTKAKVGLDYIKWIELGNEPNGEDSSGYVPYQLAAMTSAAYDGHMGTIASDVFNSNSLYFFGGKTADKNINLAMAGLAGIQTNYINSMVYWMKANRTDGVVAFDAFNVHTYFGKTFTMNGQSYMTGISPEEAGLIDQLSELLELRNKYYPEKEVWLTEFGWDTNYSYLTPTACHAYADYNSWQVQAMWLTRAYLMLSASGVDKATMYMCQDIGDDETSVEKYGTCGVISNKGEKKDSYYSMYTLKNTLGSMRFEKEIISGNENVWIYKFSDENGNVGYALWCPTSDGTKVDNFRLKIDGENATLVENKVGEIEGQKTELTVSDGVVSVNVSENPIYVIVNK